MEQDRWSPDDSSAALALTADHLRSGLLEPARETYTACPKTNDAISALVNDRLKADPKGGVALVAFS
jgi:hypothetical protein